MLSLYPVLRTGIDEPAFSFHNSFFVALLSSDLDTFGPCSRGHDFGLLGSGFWPGPFPGYHRTRFFESGGGRS